MSTPEATTAPEARPASRLPSDPEAPAARPVNLRRRVYEILEAGRGDDKVSLVADSAIVALILLNVVAFIAETVPSLEAAYGPHLRIFEAISVALFTVEYGLRIWCAVEVPFLARLKPLDARLRFARRGAQVIDLLAIAPFYLSFLLPVDLRVLRSLRLLRFLKLTRYSPAVHSLIRVISNERRALLGALLLLCTALLIASTGMYFLEHGAQPDKFGSVPDAAWWAIATLTTVGYGDLYPITPLGRLFGGIVMIMGLCILALPVAIISTGFAQEVSRRDFVVNWSLMSRIPLLAELDAGEVGAVMPLLQAHIVPPNTEIAAHGSECDAIHFIASGQVGRHCEGSVELYGTGDIVGAVAMLAHDVHTGTYITASKCRLLKLHKEDFHRLETANARLAARIRDGARERRARRNEHDRM